MSRIFVFIDAANVWSSQKRLGFLLDYQKLPKFLSKKFEGKVKQIFYYEAYPADETRAYDTSKKHKFFTYLKKGLGFKVRKKVLKQIRCGEPEAPVIQEKGNFDVEISIDAVHNKDNFDIAIFFSGDSDFLPLITFLRNAEKKVYVFSSDKTISSELRTGSDGYFDLSLTTEIHGEKLKYRKQKEKAAS